MACELRDSCSRIGWLEAFADLSTGVFTIGAVGMMISFIGLVFIIVIEEIDDEKYKGEFNYTKYTFMIIGVLSFIMFIFGLLFHFRKYKTTNA